MESASKPVADTAQRKAPVSKPIADEGFVATRSTAERESFDPSSDRDGQRECKRNSSRQRRCGNGLSRIFDITAGTVNISALTLAGGLSTSSGGGAISNSGTLTLTNSIVTGSTNTAGIGGGGVDNYGHLYLNYCTVSNNTSTNSEGGGIENRPGAVLHVNHSTISGNIMSAGGSAGGGIVNESGQVFVYYSNISGNQAVAFGGGGVFVAGGTLIMKNSTISGNQATSDGGGLLMSAGTAKLYNTTISGNYSGNTGNGAAISTDGVFGPITANVTLTSCTVSGNSAFQNSGGLWNNNNTGSVTLINTIVAGNTGLVGSSPQESDLKGNSTFTSNGYNAFGSIASATITTLASDIVSALVGANLGTLSANAPALVAGCPGATGTGVLQTMALLANNPAVGTGDPALLGTKDERGVVRGALGTVDIGAYAANIIPNLVVTAPLLTTAGATFSITVTAENAAGYTTPGYVGSVTFTSTDSNPGVVLPGPATLTKGVYTSPTTVKLVTAGSQTISATDSLNGLIGTSLGITVNPDTANLAIFFQTSVSPIAAGQVLGGGGGFKVLVEDEFANPVTGTSVTLSGAPFVAGSTVASTSGSGVATFSGLIVDAANSYTLTASTLGQTGTTELTVTPSAVFALVLSPANSSITAGSSQSFAAEFVDQFGNNIADVTTVTAFSITSANAANATVTGNSVGSTVADSYTVQGNDGGITGTTTLTVNAGPAVKLELLGFPTTTSVGLIQPLTVEAFGLLPRPQRPYRDPSAPLHTGFWAPMHYVQNGCRRPASHPLRSAPVQRTSRRPSSQATARA